MVFIPWEEHDICKFWMVGGESRCREGKACRWHHPIPQEKKRLWEHYTEDRETEVEKYKGMLRASSARPQNNREEPEMQLKRRRAEGSFLGESDRFFGENDRLSGEYSPLYGEFDRFSGGYDRFHSEYDRFTSERRLERDVGESRRRQDFPFTGKKYSSMTVNTNLPDRREHQQSRPLDRLNRVEAREVEAEVKSLGPPAADRSVMSMLPPPRPGPGPRPSLFSPTGYSRERSPRPVLPSQRMPAIKRDANGEPKLVGPHPSTIRVSAPYTTQAGVQRRYQLPSGDAQEKNLAEAREVNFRLQGVHWLDTTRRALQLPVRTFSTACVYYHKFRLAHSGADYSWADAAAASLLTSCKVEDTLKKSKDILAAAYNVKTSGHEQVSSDDPLFEGPSRAVIGLERLVLEAGGFDFRSRYPYRVLVKMTRSLPASDQRDRVGKTAWTILTDLHRTFAPMKHTSSTLALASLELAAQLTNAIVANGESDVRAHVHALGAQAWSTTREEVMETLMDALDLYTQHTAATTLGTKHGLDDFLRIRLALNKECTDSEIPRYTTLPERSGDRTANNGSTLRVSNGHPTPVSPPQSAAAQAQAQSTNGAQTAPKDGETLRFMLNPRLASDEKTEVQKYFVEEWEEYDEEIEVPIPHSHSRMRHDRGGRASRDFDRHGDGKSSGRDERDRERDKLRDTEMELERERARLRMRERERDREIERENQRERGYDDRRYDDHDRRYDDRRGPPRRYDDRDRRYGDNRRPPHRGHGRR